jgi:hypothetical protein
MSKPHTLILEVHASLEGFDLDALLDHIEAQPGVLAARDLALLQCEAAEQIHTVNVIVPAAADSEAYARQLRGEEAAS